MSSAPTESNMVAVGSAKPVVKGTSKEEYTKLVTAIKTALTYQGTLNMHGDKPRFDGGSEPNALHFGKIKRDSVRVTEEHLEEITGLRDEGFRVGDILLDGLARGKFASAWREYRAKAKMAISKFLLLVENGSPLYVIMERAAKSGDPNLVIAAAEQFYNSKTFPTLLSIIHGENRKIQELKDRKKGSIYASITGLRQTFRDSRRLFHQVFSDAERSDPSSLAKIDDLWHFCRQIAIFEDWFGGNQSIISFISLNVRQSKDKLIEFDIPQFWEAFDQHASVSRVDDNSKQQQQSSSTVPAVAPLSKEAKELASMKKHIATFNKSGGRNKAAAKALNIDIKRKSEQPKPDGDDGDDSKKAKLTCYSWRDKGKCRYGSKCKFEHEGAKATVNAFSVPMATDESDYAEFDGPFEPSLAMFSGSEGAVHMHHHSGSLDDEDYDSETSYEPIDIFTVGK